MRPFLPNPPDVGLPTSNDLRCPRCGAHVRQDAQWCTLCYADLRPAPADPVALAEPAEPGLQQLTPADSAAAPGADASPPDLPPTPPRPSRGRHARRAPDEPVGDTLGDVDVDAMLAQLAAESDSGLGALSGRLASPGAKAVVIGGGIALVCLVLVLLMVIVGSLL